MVLKSGMIRWFLEELPRLRDSGIIDPETEKNLRRYYQSKLVGAPSLQKYFLLALSIIGALLIACGVILIFNYNWDMLGKRVQILIAFLPLTMGALLSFYTIVKNRSQAWRECSALFTSAGTAVLIALVSQIYHTGGTFADFMFLVLLLAIPLIYTFNSISLSVVYCFMLFSQISWNLNNSMMSLILLGGILPFILYHLIKKESPFRYLTRYLLMICILFAIAKFGNTHILSLQFTAASLLFYGGIRLHEEKEGMWKNPWLIVGFVYVTIMLAITSSSTRISEFYINQEYALLSYLCVEGAMFAGLLAMGVMDLYRKKISAERILLLLLPPISLIPIAFGKDIALIYSYLMNLFFIAFGVILLINGWRKKSMLVFNGGFVMIATLLACRFFDSNIGLLPRAGIFILLGLSFIASNVYLSRKLGKAENNV